VIRKIVVLSWIVCFTMILPFQNFPSVLPAEAKQEKWFIRILLASQEKQLMITNDHAYILKLSGSYSFNQKENRFHILKEKGSYQNGFFTILLKSGLTLMEAQQLAIQTRDRYFKASDISFLIQETDQNQFSLSLGLFAELKEADFIASFLKSFFPEMKNTKHKTDDNAVGLQLDDNISLISAYTDSPDACKSFSITTAQSPCQYKKVSYPDTLELYLCNHTLSLVNRTDIETYLGGVVGSEMPDDWPLEALKAQTLASRTYAYSRSLAARQRNAYFDVTNDTNSQVYLGIRHLPNSFKAISATEGLIITSQSKPIESVFHSSSGGFTENNEFIWSGSPTPYLRGVPSPGEEISPHFSWYRSFTRKIVLEKLNTYLTKKQLPSLNTNPFTLSITEKGISPRVRKISLLQDKREVFLTGSDFVALFNLKSTWFDFFWYTPEKTGQVPPLLQYFGEQHTPLDQESTLYIVGRGWGHGVGMSQYGALAMAKKGSSYQDIIAHYYSGTRIESIPSFQSQSKTLQTLQNQILFDPCCVRIQNGSFLDVRMKINTQTNIFGISFEMKYPKDLIILKKEEIREGTFLKSDQKSTIFLVSESENGYKVGLSREGKVGGVTGEGDLIFFRFQGVQSGMGTIQLLNLQALDSRLEPTAINAQAMEITVFEKDTTPPVTRITQTPGKWINQRKVYFEWIGEDDQTPVSELLYSYRLNQEPWSTFSFITHTNITLLHDGPYIFSVQAKDKEGNTDTPAPEYSFILDTTPPILNISPAPAETNLSEYTLNGLTESEASVMMNGKTLAISPDGTFFVKVALSLGHNSFQFTATDKASNATLVTISILRKQYQPIIIMMTIGSKKAIVNDTVLTLDSVPFIKQDRTFVPLRFIAEAFGASVQWFPESKKIEINLDHPLVKKKIELWVDQTVAYVNQTPFTMDAPPFIVPPGRTVVPIRFIAESMESKVEWFSLTQTITITFPESLMNESTEISYLGGL